ncbi:ATP-binding protein [Capsulimonas corticalis]|uniref:ATP-binding protein n=1 Tax=Capsulimonas corticalis TaxID=2219043 RepID=A0A402CWS5_9BACT|nr:AAA family ATPase [Capsulimonas corticalis]BDI34219.1 ATP-binding protein [Capsulimonas corticalis]
MLNSLLLRNFTVFPTADLFFGENLNVFVGENGVGKTHILKAAYSVIAVSNELRTRGHSNTPTKAQLQGRLADKLVGVFRAEALGRLASRRLGRERCDIRLQFDEDKYDIAFSFATNSKSEVAIETVPTSWIEASAAYFPTRELMTIFPNFVSVYEGRYLEFEETWRDTCILLGAPPRRGPREGKIRDLLNPLEEAMGGSVDLDKNGRFYLRPNGSQSRIEMPLVAEGHRKLAMLCQLIAVGAFNSGGYLFWDEPEANLNPRLIRAIAKSIVELSTRGIQVFITTHSLFLLRELDILHATNYGRKLQIEFFGLNRTNDGVSVLQSDSLDEIGDIAALDEELQQSDRYLEQIS